MMLIYKISIALFDKFISHFYNIKRTIDKVDHQMGQKPVDKSLR